MTTVQLRTLPQALACIKAADPDSALTSHALRQMVLQGKIPHVAVGAKRLINVAQLQAYLSGEAAAATPEPEPPQERGIIRRMEQLRYQSNGGK